MKTNIFWDNFQVKSTAVLVVASFSIIQIISQSILQSFDYEYIFFVFCCRPYDSKKEKLPSTFFHFIVIFVSYLSFAWFEEFWCVIIYLLSS